MSDTDSSSLPEKSFPPARALSVAVALIFIWGLAYTMVDVAVRYFAPIWVVALRCVIATGLVAAYARYRGERLFGHKLKTYLAYGALGLTGMALPFWLLSEGQVHLDSGLTAIIVGAMPILTIILAHFFASEPLSWRKFLGFVIGFAGIVFLFLPEQLSFALVENWQAQLLIVGAALFYAITTVAAKRAPDISSLTGSVIMLCAATLFSGIWALSTGLPPAVPAMGWLMIIGLAIGSTALGTILYLYFIKMAGPSAMAKVNYFPPVVSVLAGMLLLDEPFNWRAIAALGIIFLGIWVTRSRAARPERPHHRPAAPDHG